MIHTKLFIDLDGVLADFDKQARILCGTDNSYKFEFVWGQDEFWRCINKDPQFFANLDLMPDAPLLWSTVKHLRPTILTALPHADAVDVASQKLAWVAQKLGPQVGVITCTTRDKPRYCTPGAILIDDRAANKDAWEAAGGRFIVHTSARQTLNALDDMGVVY